MDGGYVVVFETVHPNARKDGYVSDHIKVMAEHLGRPSSPSKWCIMRTGSEATTGPENLELLARGMQPPGSRVSDLVESAVRVLRLSCPELLAKETDQPNL